MMAASLPMLLALMIVIDHGLLIFATGSYIYMYYSCNCLILRACIFSTYAVTLDSSADSVCPGDTVVFTCATDTGEMIWSMVGNQFYFSTSQVTMNVDPSFPFKFTLTSTQGANLVSTATILIMFISVTMAQ